MSTASFIAPQRTDHGELPPLFWRLVQNGVGVEPPRMEIELSFPAWTRR